MAHARRHKPIRRGMTLIELMVVISIVAVLSVYALRMLPGMAEGRRVREAARSLSIYFSLAKNRAVETGRPCGVILQRMDDEPRASMVMVQAEVPPAYSGDSQETKAQLWYEPAEYKINVKVGPSFNQMLVNAGDFMQINNQGYWYKISYVNPLGKLLVLSTPPGTVLPWPEGVWTAPMSFRIVRRPKQSIAAPLQLSRGMVVDLTASGNNFSPQLFGPGNSPVIIMFSPNGSLDRCYWNNTLTGNGIPTEPLFFLIGRREQIGVGPENNYAVEDDATRSNWQILKNLWVSISPQTGLVTVTENAQAVKYYVDPDLVGVPVGISEARRYAKEAQTMGGR